MWREEHLFEMYSDQRSQHIHFFYVLSRELSKYLNFVQPRRAPSIGYTTKCYHITVNRTINEDFPTPISPQNTTL